RPGDPAPLFEQEIRSRSRPSPFVNVNVNVNDVNAPAAALPTSSWTIYDGPMSSEAARARLERALATVHGDAADRIVGGHWNRASIAPVGSLWRVAFFGAPWDDGGTALYEALAHPEVAPWIASIEL